MALSWLFTNGQSQTIQFVFYLVHGYSDRLISGRTKLIKIITESRGIVYGHDYFYHGKSGPYPQDHRKRCQIEILYHTARYLNLRIQETKQKYPNLPFVVLGFSF